MQTVTLEPLGIVWDPQKCDLGGWCAGRAEGTALGLEAGGACSAGAKDRCPWAQVLQGAGATGEQGIPWTWTGSQVQGQPWTLQAALGFSLNMNFETTRANMSRSVDKLELC